MMKHLLLVFFIILCTHTFSVTACFPIRYGNSVRLLGIPLINAIGSHCRTGGNPKQFEHAINELGNCVNDLMRERESSERFDLFDYKQDHCSYFNESQLRVCVENLTRNISPCLAEDEIYIQQFLIDAFDILYEELCGANRVSNKEYIYDKVNRNGYCMSTCLQLLGSCNTTNLNIFKHSDKGILSFNKQDVCSDLESLYGCTTQLMETVCDEEFSRLTDLIFHPLIEGCHDLEARK